MYVWLGVPVLVRYPPRFGKIGDLGGNSKNFQNEGNIFYTCIVDIIF